MSENKLVKEKGDKLIAKFSIYTPNENATINPRSSATQCAIIAVEEILSLRMVNNMGRGLDDPLSEGQFYTEVLNYLKSKL